MRRLSSIYNPRYVVFSDFDATYLSHAMMEHERIHLQKLEAFLQEESQRLGLVFGFVSGSSLEEIYNKMQLYNLSVLPHFIAGSLATEVTYECENKKGDHDKNWEWMVNKEYSHGVVTTLVKDLQDFGITLTLQPPKANTSYKRSYYYSPTFFKEVAQVKYYIGKKAKKYNIGINFSACNPTIGDPLGSYDVDFIPLKAGKHNFVRNFLQKYRIKEKNSYAFGDSENDIQMLKAVGNGYLVSNAQACAKKWEINTTSESYAGGILEILERLK